MFHILKSRFPTAATLVLLLLQLSACDGVSSTTNSSDASATNPAGGATDPASTTLSLSAASYSIAQNGGSMTVTVNRAGGSVGAVSTAYATADGTAKSGTDYTAATGTLTWNDGDATPKTFSVNVSNATPFSGSKAFTVTLSTPSGGATLTSPSTASVTINGDGSSSSSAPGSLALSAATLSVAQNAGNLTVTVNRTGGSAGAVGVSYSTSAGTAQAGTDFTASSGTLTWANGDATAKTFTVPISNATPFSGSKQFTVTLSSPTGGAALGSPNSSSVTINGDAGSSSASTLQLSAATDSVAQSTGTVSISVTRTGSSGAVSVAYATSNGTATAGTDYTAASGTLNWADGDSSAKSFPVAIATTPLFSGTKTFTVTLSSPMGGATLGTPTSAVVSIAGSSTSSGAFGIKVSGNKFVSTRDGSTVQIVGANISGLENGGYNSMWSNFASAGTAFWSQVVNWGGAGINAVRLPLNEASWLNYTCYDSGSGGSASFYSATSGGAYQPDPAGIYQATVKKAVADATASGLYVILDLHWGAPNNASGQPLCPIGQPGYADTDHSVTFWTQVANAFKDNPAVIFELFNEPFGTNTYSNWVTQNGSTYTPGPEALMMATGGNFSPFDAQNNSNNNVMYQVNMTWKVAGMITLLNTIRATGATNVVIGSPIGWAGEIETWLGSYTTNGNPDPLKQFGVAWHLYGYAKGTAPALAVLNAGYPILVTETYGFDSALDGGQNANGYTWAASNHIGYLWWGWNDWSGQALSTILSQAPWYMSTPP